MNALARRSDDELRDILRMVRPKIPQLRPGQQICAHYLMEADDPAGNLNRLALALMVLEGNGMPSDGRFVKSYGRDDAGNPLCRIDYHHTDDTQAA